MTNPLPTGSLQRLTPSPIRHFAAVGLSAAALALYGRIGWPWILLGWGALVPWLAALDRTASLRGALLSAWLMSEAFVLALFYWLPDALRSYSGLPWLVGLGFVLLAAPLLEPQFIALALGRRLAAARAPGASLPLAPLAGACAYVGVEWAAPKLFGDTLGLGLFPSPLLRQGADVAGVQGLTFLLLISNECLLAIVQGAFGSRSGFRRLLTPAACLLLLIALPLGYGALRLRPPNHAQTAARPVTAALVQAGFSHYDRMAAELGRYETVRRILEGHFTLSRQALGRGGIDLLIWPESVYPTTFGAPKSQEGAEFDRLIGAFVLIGGVPLVFGAYESDEGKEFNAAVFLEPAAQGPLEFETYRKSRLFPLTEQVPPLLDRPSVHRLLPWLGTWRPGNGPKVLALTLPDGRVLKAAPLICYDAFDPAHAIAAVRGGAELILTLSNDSWFDYGSTPRLILIISAFRSIETRRPQLRVTNTGVSAIITPTGEISGLLELHEQGVLVGSIQPQGGQSLLLILGDWLGPSALAATALMLGLALARRRKQPRFSK